MHTTTLRGVFPEPKPIHRRNFIQENVKSIKQMQGILQEAGVIKKKPKRLDENERINNVLRIPLKSRDSDTTARTLSTKNSDEKVRIIRPTTKIIKKAPKPRRESYEHNSRFTTRGIQTERSDDVSHIYETGTIKFASPNVLSPIKKSRKSPIRLQAGQGDVGDDKIIKEMNKLSMDEKDFVKENKQNIKPKPPKQQNIKVQKEPPPNYQRGVVPKYLRDRKEDFTAEIADVECPPGHVLLPEEERKETLKVLRQSYADRIQELNMMPVRNDTLKMKKRKIELEEELKRIDGGIKVFQRPKVFVKINA